MCLWREFFFFLFDEAGKEKGKKMDYAFDLRERKKAFFFFVDKSPIKWSIFVSIRNKNNKEQQTTSNFQPELLTCPFYSFFFGCLQKTKSCTYLEENKRKQLSTRSSKRWYKTIQLIFQFFFGFFFYNLWREQQCIPATNKFFVIPLKCFYGMIV